ncbi:MAG: hypothetical protein AB7U83_19535 [Vicinamibacterales bacterium]
MSRRLSVSAPRRVIAATALVAVAWTLAVGAQSTVPSQAPLPLDPARERGVSVTPAYEGWYTNADGSYSLLVGYFNRNRSQTLDIPVGPNNKIEPGPIDQGQPTHFQVGRQWGVFVIKVPKDFGTKAITWTITSNGETQSIPLTLNRNYPIEPYEEKGMGNKPPVFTFGGTTYTGPPTAVAATLTGTVGEPVAISFVVADPKQTKQGSERRTSRSPGVATVSFHKFRGPGTVTFEPARIATKAQDETVATKAVFSAAGEYLLRVQGNDESGEGGAGFQCCWTNTYVKVTVK